MPRVHTQKAGKDYPEQGIKKGDTYYRWTFYRQRPQISKTYPKRSQLTQREELVAIYSAEEAYNEIAFEESDRAWLMAELEDVKTLVEEARDAAQEKADNITAYFQESEQAQALEQFVCELEDLVGCIEEMISNLEDEEQDLDGIDFELDFPECEI